MKSNVIWILVDGIRNYPDLDKQYSENELAENMGLLPIMKKIGEENIFFSRAICSATSTAMSISSQMTGCPSYYLSRSFDDFKYDSSEFSNLGHILKNNGLNVYGLSFAIDVRILFKGIIDHIDKKFWPKGLNNYKAWNNDAVSKMFTNLLDVGLKQPFFLFIHLNGRYDPDISNRVEGILATLEEEGYYDDDSILIMNSDHGIPDPSRERSKSYYDWMSKNNVSINRHDLIMTDDNILIPLIMKYPNCPSKTIDIQIGAIDIFYTILDLLGIEYNNKFSGEYLGKSLVPLINGKNENEYILRKFRTDTRYITQDDKLTAVTGSNFKYVYSETDIGGLDKQQFYDLNNDPFEKNNLFNSESINIQRKIENYQTIFDEMEKEAIDIQEKYLTRKFRKNITKYVKDNINQKKDKILILALCNNIFTIMFINCCKKYFKEPQFTIVNENYQLDGFKDYNGRSLDKIDCYKTLDIINDKQFIAVNKSSYKIAFVLLDNKIPSNFKSLSIFLKRLDCTVIFSDYNCQLSKSLRKRRMEYLIKKAKFNIQNKYFGTPFVFFRDLLKLFSGKI